MLALMCFAPQMLVHPLPSHKLTLARPVYASTQETVHSVTVSPRTRLSPSEDLAALIEAAPKEPSYATCTTEIMYHIDDVTRQQTNVLLFFVWLQFVLVLAFVRN